MNNTAPQNEEQPKKKIKIKKFKLTAMDYITIGFTAVIVIIMAVILLQRIRPDWFTSSKKENAAPTVSAQATPQSTPTLSDMGNTYGNLSNNPFVCEIDDRLYFISAGKDDLPYIYATFGEETKALLQTNATCLNVITDPFTYADDTSSSAYTVFFLDADGNICYFTDGPIYDEQPFTESAVAKKIFKEGAYRAIAIRGEYLFFIDGDGHVGKMSLVEESYAVLSKEKYTTLTVYGTSIYALNEQGSLYLISSSGRPAATATPTADPSATAAETSTPTPTSTATPVPGIDEYEMMISEEKVSHFCIDGSYIYTISDAGVVCRTGDGTQKYTLSTRKGDLINVLDDKIYILSEGTLYAGTAKDYLLGKEVPIGSVATKTGINLTENAVYVYAGGLKVSTYDSETDAYSALDFVVLP